MTKNIDKEFVPYEEALDLKELGFDEPCFSYYNKEVNCNLCWKSNSVEPYNHNDTTKYDSLSAPTFSQAFRFFREKYGYDIHIKGTNFRASYVIGIPKEINMKAFDGYPLVISWDYITDETGVRKTYEEAELDCLKKLIEIAKEQNNEQQ
jgi:hypothetical protein